MKWRKTCGIFVVSMFIAFGSGIIIGGDEIVFGIMDDAMRDMDTELNPPQQIGKPLKRPSILDEKKRKQDTPISEAIRAKRFELVDSKGKVRAVLAMTSDDEPRLALADRAGHIQAMLSIEPVAGNPDGNPTLRLIDKAGQTRTDISLTHDGNPVISLRNHKGGYISSLTGMDAAKGGTEWLLGDENGKIRVSLNITHLGTYLSFTDKDGKARANFGLKQDGSPTLLFYDEKGKEHAVLGYPVTKKTRVGLIEK